MGGREKGEIRLAGRRLIDIVVEGALAAGCVRAVIAGGVTSASAITVREEPPFGGPVSGLARTLQEVETDWVMLLSCDLPHSMLLCHLLAESFRGIEPDHDGLLAVHAGHRQWLAGIYRRSSIEASLDRFDDLSGVSFHALLGSLNLREAQDPEGLSRDIDTPEDLESVIRKEL